MFPYYFQGMRYKACKQTLEANKARLVLLCDPDVLTIEPNCTGRILTNVMVLSYLILFKNIMLFHFLTSRLLCENLELNISENKELYFLLQKGSQSMLPSLQVVCCNHGNLLFCSFTPKKNYLPFIYTEEITSGSHENTSVPLLFPRYAIQSL